MIVGLIIMAISIIFLLIGIFVLNNRIKKTRHESRIKELEKSKEIEEYKRKLLEAENSSVRSEGCENRIIELNHRIEEKQVRIESIDNEIKAKTGILTHVTLE